MPITLQKKEIMAREKFSNYASESVQKRFSDSFLIRRLLAYLRPHRLWVLLAILLLVLARGLEAWIPVRSGQLVQKIVDHQGAPLAERHELFNVIFQGCLALLGWIFLNYLLDLGNILIKNWVGQKAVLKMRTEIFEHIQNQSMPFFDHAAIGRLMTRTIHDVDQINQLFSESVIPLIGSLFLFIGILTGIFLLDRNAGILFCLICPLIFLLLNYFRVNQRLCYDRIRSIVSAMNAFIQENLMGVNVIRNFGMRGVESQKFNKMNKDHYDENIKTIHYFSFFFSGIEFLQNLTMIAFFILFVYLVSPGTSFQIGAYFTISMYGLMIFRPLLDLAERYNILQSAMAASERIFEMLASPVEALGPEPGLTLEGIDSIVFDDVWFAYEGENWILRGISFSLKKGESLALVGPTGSGKTSVMNVLMRFYPFQKGHIYINGHDIRRYSIPNLRSHFNVILQDSVIFSGTVFDNIALYDRSVTLDQVRSAADFVNLTPVIERLPGHFDHVLTERGSSLSVGEAQLISFARSIAHGRSALILDEATANIDMHTEKIIQTAMKKLLSHKTAIVIAHRLSTIQDVTRILVLRQGLIAESGTHDELIKAKGVYEKLCTLQFAS
jgi:ATP-binding cassette subfamily B multidrug efflux pump